MNDKEKVRTLFHYTSEARLRGIVSSEKLWANNSAFLKDASEFNYLVDWVTQIMKRPDLGGIASAYEFGNASPLHGAFKREVTIHYFL